MGIQRNGKLRKASRGSSLTGSVGSRHRLRKGFIVAAKRMVQQSEESKPCAYMACLQNAVIRTKVGAHSWSDYCHRHYLEYHTRKAEETCHELALTSMDAKRAWVILKAKAFARKWAE